MREQFQKQAKRLLAAGLASAALLAGSGQGVGAQQEFIPVPPPAMPGMLLPALPPPGAAPAFPGLKNVAGYTCLPRRGMVRDFNRNAIDMVVDMDFSGLPSTQNMLAAMNMRGWVVCPDKSLRRLGLSLGETLLSPGPLPEPEIARRAARNELLMAYELSNAWLSANGRGDRLLFPGLQENQQYHALREAGTWALTAGILFDLKNMRGRPEPWNMALQTPYRDIFMAYEQAFSAAPDSEFRGIPHLRAFQQWFADSGRGMQVMEEVNWLLHGGAGLRTPQSLTPEFLAGIGARPEPGRPNFFSEVQNSLSPYPDRDPTRPFVPGR